MKRRWSGRLAILVLLISMVALPALAQRGRRFFIPASAAPVKYDGRFVIVRLWYQAYPGWSYDYPDMEQNLSKILEALTLIGPNPRGTNIFRMDDPELLKFPIAYLSEPGYWYPTESEARGLRDYLDKGGFVIID